MICIKPQWSCITRRCAVVSYCDHVGSAASMHTNTPITQVLCMIGAHPERQHAGACIVVIVQGHAETQHSHDNQLDRHSFWPAQLHLRFPDHALYSLLFVLPRPTSKGTEPRSHSRSRLDVCMPPFLACPGLTLLLVSGECVATDETAKSS